MSTLHHDLKSAWRASLAAPVPTAAAILVVALGVGMNVAVFAVTYGVLLRPLPFQDVDRLVLLKNTNADGSEFGTSLDRVMEWRRGLRTVEDLAGYATDERPLRGVGEPRLVQVASVTETFFDVLGVAAARGQVAAFRESDDAVVLSTKVAGEDTQAVRVGERTFDLAAVMPADFGFPSEQVDAWIPAVAAADRSADVRRFTMVARLKPEASLDQLREDAARVRRDVLGLREPKPGVDPNLEVTSLQDAVAGPLRPVLGATTAAAFLVLLVTCADVAMLLLGRAVLRRRESAVRLALGAGGWDLVRATLVESLLLAAAGSLVGLGLAGVALRVFARAAAGIVPRAHEVRLDPPVLAVALATVLFVVALCALAPAFQVDRQSFSAAFRSSRAGEPRTHRLLTLLVVGQIAASLVLLCGAALLVQTVLRLLAEDTGFEASRTLTLKLPLGEGGTRTVPADAVRRALADIRALPGVETGGVGTTLPPDGLPFQFFMRWHSETRDEGLRISLVGVTPGFLDAMGARLVGGRFFDASDLRFAEDVVVLSESAARFVAPGEDLVDREYPQPLPPVVHLENRPRVVGLVGDVKYAGLDAPASAAIYLPWGDAFPSATSYLLLRTAGEPMALADGVRRILREMDPELPIAQVRTLEEAMRQSISDRRLRLVPALGFAAVALLVALSGIFALFARAAAERRREIAIRMAVGASRGQIRGLLLGRAAWVTGAGLLVGLGAAVAVTRGLRTLLFGVGPNDLPTLAAAVAVVAAAALLAAYLPAHRASRVEPWDWLRTE